MLRTYVGAKEMMCGGGLGSAMVMPAYTEQGEWNWVQIRPAHLQQLTLQNTATKPKTTPSVVDCTSLLRVAIGVVGAAGE
jgi:hypothetical protein